MTIHVNLWTVKHDSMMLKCMSPFRINLNVDAPTAEPNTQLPLKICVSRDVLIIRCLDHKMS